jgi:SAM-dependent methyltransferase
MALDDSTTTFRLFQHDRVADGYRSARPYLHPAVFDRVSRMIQLREPLARALDVGCGTGLSTGALRRLAREVVGVDSSIEMLRRATVSENIRYAACAAESLPFRPARFDLVVACGSIDWIDRGRFVPAVGELLVPGGWFVPLDFGDTGRARNLPELGPWYDKVFLRRYPRPSSADPMVTPGEAALSAFDSPVEERFAFPCTFTAEQYADFLMTESNVIAAVEYGSENAAGVRHWLAEEIRKLTGDKPISPEFGGYIQALRKQ